jgi:hypothetical protein
MEADHIPCTDLFHEGTAPGPTAALTLNPNGEMTSRLVTCVC